MKICNINSTYVETKSTNMEQTKYTYIIFLNIFINTTNLSWKIKRELDTYIHKRHFNNIDTMYILKTLNICEEVQIDLYKVRDALCYIEPHNQYVEKMFVLIEY